MRVSECRPSVSVAVTFASLVLLVSASTFASSGVVGPFTIWADAAQSRSPQVVYNSLHDEFLVVWWNIQGPNSQDIFARRVGLDGTLGARFPIVVQAGESHLGPVVAYNETRDEYFIVWEWESGTGDRDLLGATASWNGGLVSTPFWIVADSGNQTNAQLAFNSAHDEYLVVYTDAGGVPYWQVSARRLSGAGAFLSGSIIASDSGADCWDPRVAYDPQNDQYLITYIFEPTTDWFVHGKVVPFDLAGAAGLTSLNIGSGTDSWNAAVAAGPTGYFLAWERNFKPRGRQIAATGVPLGTSLGMLLGDTSSQISGAHSQTTAVAYSPSVGYVVAWQHLTTPPSNPDDGDVYIRVVSATENTLTSPQITVANGPEYQQEVAIACTPWGLCMVAHETDDNIEAHLVVLQIHADGFESGGTFAWSSTVP